MKLQVGHTYLSRDGREFNIGEYYEGRFYEKSFKAQGNQWRETGLQCFEQGKNDLDLVREIYPDSEMYMIEDIVIQNIFDIVSDNESANEIIGRFSKEKINKLRSLVTNLIES